MCNSSNRIADQCRCRPNVTVASRKWTFLSPHNCFKRNSLLSASPQNPRVVKNMKEKTENKELDETASLDGDGEGSAMYLSLAFVALPFRRMAVCNRVFQKDFPEGKLPLSSLHRGFVSPSPNRTICDRRMASRLRVGWTHWETKLLWSAGQTV